MNNNGLLSIIVSVLYKQQQADMNHLKKKKNKKKNELNIKITKGFEFSHSTYRVFNPSSLNEEHDIKQKKI